jgi:hypothetical protein
LNQRERRERQKKRNAEKQRDRGDMAKAVSPFLRRKAITDVRCSIRMSYQGKQLKIVKRTIHIAPLGISFFILVFSVLLFTHGLQLSVFPPTYWLIAVYRPLIQFLALSLPIVLVVLLVWIVLVDRQDFRSYFALVATIILSAGMCILCQVIIPFDTTSLPHAEVSFGENNFFVVSEWGAGWNDTPGAHFDLYECDKLGFNCKIIHQEFFGGMRLREYETVTAQLLSQPCRQQNRARNQWRNRLLSLHR